MASRSGMVFDGTGSCGAILGEAHITGGLDHGVQLLERTNE